MKTWILFLSLISSPALAQTLTADTASSKQLAIEIQFCAAYFKAVSSCFEDKNLPRNLGPEDKKRMTNLVRIYDEQALKALKSVTKIIEATHTSTADMDTHLLSAMNRLMAEMKHSCTNIGSLQDKYAPVCNPLVHNPLLRLKVLSECPHEGKVGC